MTLPVLFGGNSGKGTVTVNATVSASTNAGLNFSTLLTSAGWNGTTPVNGTVTINSSVVVGAPNTGAYAMTIPAGFPAGSTLTLVISSGAYLVGAGGNAPTAGPGAQGGPALFVGNHYGLYTVKVNNLGVMGGGGGSGAPGYCASDGDGGDCGTGGGGAGAVAGTSGTDYYPSDVTLYAHSTAGTLTTGGNAFEEEGDGYGDVNCNNAGTGGLGGGPGVAGGNGTAQDPTDDEYSNQGGGGGGGLGAAGGTDSYSPSPTNPGGAAGACTTGNTYITWVATGTRYGALN